MRLRRQSTSYDYAGQDPINNYDLNGEMFAGPGAGGIPQARPKLRNFIIGLLSQFGLRLNPRANIEVKATRDGGGLIFREEGSNSWTSRVVRIMFKGTTRYPNGELRFTNAAGEYVDPRTGLATSRYDPLSHIAPGYSGPWKGLPSFFLPK